MSGGAFSPCRRNQSYARRGALIVLIALLAAPAVASAQGLLILPGDQPVWLPRPRPITPMPRVRPVPPVSYKIKSIDVRAAVTDQLAKVQISQTFLNTGPQQLEAKFVFPLPPDAAIDQMTLLVDGKELAGRILKSDEARKIYEDIVRRSQDPALLEWIGWGMYQTNVFPIPPGAERTVQIRYSQLCRKDHGLIECGFPLGTAKYTAEAPESVNIQFNIEAAGPIRNIYSPTHTVSITRTDDRRATARYSASREVPGSDFRLFYDTHGGAVGASVVSYRPSEGEDGYFLLLATPEVKRDGADRGLKTIELVLDKSGSMEGQKIDQAKKALKYVVERLHEGDLFNIVTYDDKVETFRPELQRFNEDTRRAALAYVDAIFAGGSTNIDGALSTTLAQLNPDGPGRIVSDKLGDDLSPLALANLPADGRRVRVRVTRRDIDKIIDPGITPGLIVVKIDDAHTLAACAGKWAKFSDLRDAPADSNWYLEGQWETRAAERWLVIDSANRAMQEVMRMADRPKYVVFLTDGLPTAGETNEAKIVENAKRLNSGRARMISFGVGYDVNSRLLDKLARVNFGQSEYVRPNEDIEAHVSRLYNRISSPVMTDVAVNLAMDNFRDAAAAPINRVYPKDVYDLFEGDQLVLVGRYRQSGPASVTIKGRIGGKEEAFRYPAEFARSTADMSYAFVEKLWATRRIGEIIDELDLKGRNQELINELVALSTRHGIITPYTSFLADEGNDIRAVTANVAAARDNLTSLEAVGGKSGFAQRRAKQSLRDASAAPASPAEKAGGNAAVMQDMDDHEVTLTTVQNIANKTFYQRAQGWIDSTVTAEQEKKAVKLVQFSEEYFKLAVRNGALLAQLPATQQPVFLNLDGQTYRIEPPASK